MNTTTTRAMTKLRLASTQRPTPGPCIICGAPATEWERSGRRDTDADGLTLAWRHCHAHDAAAAARMRACTLADVAATIRPSQRARRAEALRRRADRLRGHGRSHYRAAATLRGASSATHSAALLGGYAELEAAALDRLAALLESED